MNQGQTDRRVRRTRTRLQQAMLELLQEKDARSITVRELTQRADVNRGTFYAHYKDVFDLLDQMEAELFERLSSLLSSYAPEDLQKGLTPLLTDVFRCFCPWTSSCGAAAWTFWCLGRWAWPEAGWAGASKRSRNRWPSWPTA